MNFDYILKGGTIITGIHYHAVPVQGDIGIKEDRIKAIGNLSETGAGMIINAAGFCICPGFIDSHSHSEFTLLADARAEGKICQGVTTEINGNCGLSAAPLYGAALEQRTGELESLHIEERWNSLSEYLSLLSKKNIAVNFMTLVGHGNLRASVVGYKNRPLMSNDKSEIYSLLRDSLGSGAIGLSTGLIYPPGIYSDTSEIIELARETGRYGGSIYTTHMRSEGNELLEAVDEVIKIGFDSGIHVHISHLKTNEEKNWGKLEEVLARINTSREEGLRLTCDRYPYIASGTGLDAILPSWVYEGGHDKQIERIKHNHKELERDILRQHPEGNYWEKVVISSVMSGKNKWMEGKSLYEVSIVLKKTPLDCLFKLLIEEKTAPDAIFFTMKEDNLKSILKYPFTMIGSDSAARSFHGITAGGKPHPRGFGSFPRVLGRYVRDEKIMSLEGAVHKMTGLPAQTFGIKQRGIITEGYFADITVFDPDKIADKSGFDNPYVMPEGMKYVFVNGIPVLWEGEVTGNLPGRVLFH